MGQVIFQAALVGIAHDGPHSHDQRDELFARVELARVRSQELVAKCVELVVEARLTIRESAQERLDVRNEYRHVHDALHDTVHDYAGLLRRSEVPPEKAVVEVKRMLTGAQQWRADHRVERDVTDEVVSWAIESYFEVAD